MDRVNFDQLWWVGGWCGEVKTRANLSQVKLKLRLSLATVLFPAKMHYVPVLQPARNYGKTVKVLLVHY